MFHDVWENIFLPELIRIIRKSRTIARVSHWQKGHSSEQIEVSLVQMLKVVDTIKSKQR